MSRKTKAELQEELDAADGRIGILEEQVAAYSAEIDTLKGDIAAGKVYVGYDPPPEEFLDGQKTPGGFPAVYPADEARGLSFIRNEDYVALVGFQQGAMSLDPDDRARGLVKAFQNGPKLTKAGHQAFAAANKAYTLLMTEECFVHDDEPCKDC